MRCRVAQRLISIALDGELDSERDRALQEHLADCEACRCVATGFRRVGATLESVHAVEPKWGFGERLAKRIADSERPSTARSGPGLRGRLAVGAAAFCAGAALVILANGSSAEQFQPRGDALAIMADRTIGLSAGPAPDEQLIRLLFPSLEE